MRRYRFGALVLAWDEQKASANLRKHRVTFQEGATVFADAVAREADDPDHSTDEARFLLVGHSLAGRVLLVGYAEKGDTIRIMSAETMRDKCAPKSDRLNPHVGRLAAKDRAALARWWTMAAENVRVLPKALAREFPDTRSTVAALRMVLRLRQESAPRPPARRSI